jgi:hypothetical protein
MCNAWNHAPNCTCGWGGQEHVSRHTGGAPTDTSSLEYRYWPSGIPPIRKTIESYTSPNARCPGCGASVFYYCNAQEQEALPLYTIAPDQDARGANLWATGDPSAPSPRHRLHPCHKYASAVCRKA